MEFATLRVQARLVLSPRTPRLSVEQTWSEAGGVFSVHGRTSPQRLPLRLEVAIARPALHFGLLLRQALQQAGIRGSRKARLKLRPPPAQARLGRLLYTHRSPPLQQLLPLALRDSSNQAAEAILRATALQLRKSLPAPPTGPVTHQEAVAALAHILHTDFPASHAQARLLDGAGLSPGGQVSAALLLRVLQELWGDAVLRQAFFPALSRLGVNGTLRYRAHPHAMRGRLQAKTGSLRGVSNLCGLITPPGGQPLLFAFLLYRPGTPFTRLQRHQDNALARIYRILQQR